MDNGLVVRGEYVELVPHERIVFSFGVEPDERVPALPPGSSRVEITLTPDGTGTILALRHSGLPAGTSEAQRDGWLRHLPLLATAAAGAVT